MDDGSLAKPRPGSRFHIQRANKSKPTATPGFGPGTVVGDFRLVALVGQGGMGQVWEARQLSLGDRRVALKVVRPERADERQLELFAREARAGGRLQHPGIVSVYAHGESNGLAWIAMEFVEGAWTLRDFLDELERTGVVPPDYDGNVAELVAEIAEAVEAAHELQVIHRDLKPQNVLITPDDRPKLTDFGLARILDESALSMTGDFSGTYLYMSPEQVTGRRMGIDHRTDIFSLGIVLYELLALQRPFQGDTEHQIAAQIVTKDPPDPRSYRSRVPHELALIAGKALEKDRDRRYPTMAEFAADLRRFLAHEPIRAQPPTPVDRVRKWVRRNPTPSGVLAVASAALVTILFLLIETQRARDELAASLAELSVKTTLAKSEQARADREAVAARAARDEVFRLSAMQRLEDLELAATQLWPAVPANVQRFETWLSDARQLVGELPEHRATLEKLMARAVAGDRDPRRAQLERLRRRLTQLTTPSGGSEGPRQEPAAEEAGVDWASLPNSPNELNSLAWTLVDPDRAEWGEEERGLVLARRVMELTRDDTPGIRAKFRDTLVWALFANTFFDEALNECRVALSEASLPDKPEYEGYLARLERLIALEQSQGDSPGRQRELEGLRLRVSELEREIQRSEKAFETDVDQWWFLQLERVVAGLVAFEAREGLGAEPSPRESAWSVRRRLEFARTVEEKTLKSPDAARRWQAAIASIADRVECPLYGGLTLEPQLGLLPLGRDPRTGLWEFAHLQTGELPGRDSEGELHLTEASGLVLVLLPAGKFLMGAQYLSRDEPNFDPAAKDNEMPVRRVDVPAFFLSKFEMTQAQWVRCTGENPSLYSPAMYGPNWNSRREPGTLLHPVENVSWLACATLVANFRLVLPSEEQWEYAARAGTATPWWCGEADEIEFAGNVADQFAKRNGGAEWAAFGAWNDGYTSHAPVGSFGANPFGLHDTIGNVCEWCSDLFDPALPDRVVRGGGFAQSPSGARSSVRDFSSPGDIDVRIGLRPARAIETNGAKPEDSK